MKLRQRVLAYRPSASMIVALIALFVAMGGTTYAVKGLPKRSVGSAQLRSNAVRTKHIKARNVTRSRIARSAIDSSLVSNNSLTGSDINESKLGTVPSATDAAKVNGRTAQKIFFSAPAGTAATPILTLDGLTLTATCDAGPAQSIAATTAASGAIIHSNGGTTGGGSWYRNDDAFDVGETFDPTPPVAGGTNVSGTLTYFRPDTGDVVTATFLAQETATGYCVFAGNAIG